MDEVHRGGRDGGEKLVAQCQEMGVVVHEHARSGLSQKQLVEHIGDWLHGADSRWNLRHLQALACWLMDIVGGSARLRAGIIIPIVGP